MYVPMTRKSISLKMKFTLTLIVKKSIRVIFSQYVGYQLFPITSLEVYQDSTNARVPRL